MSLILNIDTSSETATVSLAENGSALLSLKNDRLNDHATFLHKAINELCVQTNIKLASIQAVAVTEGPGSYTGLRVGLASAKGLCYGLNIPLICVNSLRLLAHAAIYATVGKNKSDLFCPLIDARRMEVYTAIFDKELKLVAQPMALILNEKSFEGLLENNEICFFGSGSDKFRAIIDHSNARFEKVIETIDSLNLISQRQFLEKDFADLAYSEPFYLKDFYSSPDLHNKK